MKTLLKNTLSTLTLTFILCSTANAATITVNLDGSGDYVSIQTAIDAAGNGDTIEVAAGMYTEGTATYRNWGKERTGLNFFNKNNITLIGTGPSTVIDFDNSYYGLMFDASHGITVSNFTGWNADKYFTTSYNNPSNINITNVVFGGSSQYGFYDYYNAMTHADVSVDANFTSSVAAVPVPAAVWLFGSAMMGLVGIRRKKT